MISPTEWFAAAYGSVLVQFNLAPGTTAALAQIGVRDSSKLTASAYPNMPVVSTVANWKALAVFFKTEGTMQGSRQTNIGLGTGAALDVFNNGIRSCKRLPR